MIFAAPTSLLDHKPSLLAIDTLNPHGSDLTQKRNRNDVLTEPTNLNQSNYSVGAYPRSRSSATTATGPVTATPDTTNS